MILLCCGYEGWLEPSPALAEVDTDKDDAMFSNQIWPKSQNPNTNKENRQKGDEVEKKGERWEWGFDDRQ